jgi:hypothetical protein
VGGGHDVDGGGRLFGDGIFNHGLDGVVAGRGIFWSPEWQRIADRPDFGRWTSIA